MNTVRSTFFQTIKRKELLLILVLIIAGISLKDRYHMNLVNY